MNNEIIGRRKPRHGRRLGWGRQALLLAALAVIVMGVVGGTVAYLVTKTDSVVNTFDPGYVKCEIHETFEEPYIEKKNVYVTNTGNTDAYIRAAIIFTWKDEEGNISATKPGVGKDVVYTVNRDWIQQEDGYYYYKNIVKPGDPTTNLSDLIKVIGNNDGYTLSVEILADAIQAEPASVVEETWKVKVENGQIQAPAGAVTN